MDRTSKRFFLEQNVACGVDEVDGESEESSADG